MPGSFRLISGVAAVLSAATLFGGVVSRIPAHDGARPLGNAGGGYAPGGWSALYPDGDTQGENLCATRPNCTKLWSLHKFSKGYVYEGDYQYYTNHVLNFVGGADIPLDANALLAVSNSFAKCRANKGTVIPRFAYTWDGWGGCEPDDFGTILVHIRQLGAVISLFPDVVPAVECGIIGAYGEMHTSRYAGAEHARPVIEAWLRNTPASMPILVRSPAYVTRFAGLTTDEVLAAHPGKDGSDFDRLGFYNDGYLGTDYDYGTWSGPNSPSGFSREQGRVYLAARDLPYGGEFATVTDEYFEKSVHLLDTARFNIVAEWYDTHLSYLRTIRATGMTVTQKLAAKSFAAVVYDFPTMPFLGEYDGRDLRTFCEDHMGARLVVRGVRLVDRGARARLQLVVENTGFGAFAVPSQAVVVLRNGSATADVAGEVRTDRRLLPAGATQMVAVSFAVPEAVRDGNVWDVGLRLCAPLRPFALANAGAYDAATGANGLCSAVFDGTGDASATWRGWWMRSNARHDWARGGRWLADEVRGERTLKQFAADAPLAAGRGCEVRLRMRAGSLTDLPPAEDAAPVSFVCLRENGALVPYGFAAGAWHRLRGRTIVEDTDIEVLATLSPAKRGVRRVSFAVDGVPCADDETGAAEFDVAFDGEGPRSVKLLGPGTAYDLHAAAFSPSENGSQFIVR